MPCCNALKQLDYEKRVEEYEAAQARQAANRSENVEYRDVVLYPESQGQRTSQAGQQQRRRQQRQQEQEQQATPRFREQKAPASASRQGQRHAPTPQRSAASSPPTSNASGSQPRESPISIQQSAARSQQQDSRTPQHGQSDRHASGCRCQVCKPQLWQPDGTLRSLREFCQDGCVRGCRCCRCVERGPSPTKGLLPQDSAKLPRQERAPSKNSSGVQRSTGLEMAARATQIPVLPLPLGIAPFKIF